MTKQELINKIAWNTKVAKKDISQVLDTFFEVMRTDVLEKGESIRYGPYGKFYVKEIPSKTVKLNNKTIVSEPKKRVTFKPFTKMQKRITNK